MDFSLPQSSWSHKVLPEDKRKGFMAGTPDDHDKTVDEGEMVRAHTRALREKGAGASERKVP